MFSASYTFGPQRGLDQVRDGDRSNEGAQPRIVSFVYLGLIVQYRLYDTTSTPEYSTIEYSWYEP